jgi:hypothetical protein
VCNATGPSSTHSGVVHGALVVARTCVGRVLAAVLDLDAVPNDPLHVVRAEQAVVSFDVHARLVPVDRQVPGGTGQLIAASSKVFAVASGSSHGMP